MCAAAFFKAGEFLANCCCFSGANLHRLGVESVALNPPVASPSHCRKQFENWHFLLPAVGDLLLCFSAVWLLSTFFFFLDRVAGKNIPAFSMPGATDNDHYVYSLHSLSSPGKAYIGYTTKNPSVRLQQHNGELCGGARPTKLHRPWALQSTVGPFPTKAAALQFEHGWTYPRTRALGFVRTKKGFWPAKSAYATLLARTRNMSRGSSSKWNLEVLDVMLVRKLCGVLLF